MEDGHHPVRVLDEAAISDDDKAASGKYMMVTVVAWFGVLLAVAVVAGLVFAN